VFFSRKYLWRLARRALTGGGADGRWEVMSPRSALGLLLLSFAGAFVWARWVGVSALAVLVFFLFLVLLGLVAAKLRAECGAPGSDFVPGYAVYVLVLGGGVAVFGPEGIVVATLLSFIFCGAFFVLPGLQIELIELGRRCETRPRHIVYIWLLGLVGGLVLGGWIFLSNAYALGGDNMNRAVFMPKTWYVQPYTVEITNGFRPRACRRRAARAPRRWRTEASIRQRGPVCSPRRGPSPRACCARCSPASGFTPWASSSARRG
jgi:hypothetical protein